MGARSDVAQQGSEDQWLARRLANTAEQLGQRRARQMMRDLRRSASERAKAHKEDIRTRIELGGEVLSAGLKGWTQDEVLGLLLDGRDRAVQSPTARLAMRKRGEIFRATRTPGGRAQNPSPAAPVGRSSSVAISHAELTPPTIH